MAPTQPVEPAPLLRIEIVPAALRRTLEAPAGEEIECRPVERQAQEVAALPASVRELLATGDTGPLVLVSFGTVFHTRGALRVVTETLAGMPVRSIVLGTDRSTLGVPARRNQLCLPWLDQTAILPFCQAVVSHGGAGTVLGALAHGCPLVVLPQGADHFRNAAALSRVGAGCVLEAPVDPTRLEAAIGDVLEGRGRAGAEATARTIGELPSPPVAAARLVAALESRRSSSPWTARR